MSRPLPSASRDRKRLRAAALLAALVSLSACEGRETPPGPNEPCVGAACGPQQPPDTALEGSVRIAAFNVQRLFDTVCDSDACGGSNYEALPTPSEFGLQADRLASAISRLNADVVLLAEVETQASLDALTSRLPRFGYSELGETGAAASVDVAVLSVHPITDVRGHRERTLWRPDGSATRFSRELLEVHLDVDGKKVIVFSAHFRSKSNDDAGRRFAEAVAARDIVAGAALAAPDALVVLGETSTTYRARSPSPRWSATTRCCASPATGQPARRGRTPTTATTRPLTTCTGARRRLVCARLVPYGEGPTGRLWRVGPRRRVRGLPARALSPAQAVAGMAWMSSSRSIFSLTSQPPLSSVLFQRMP
ncbi:hypothetical protein QEG98_24480 [Myxococcus sp. MxC21-1]|uniref:endonuclease/exonuclease/phosphatase family protein n=1 Tax=Myxococcus sp. MxC21-1 TaxID=3041439 RepID=UPI00293055D9|nr:endonuclease/exonuclease/phosphatase family protein [Myxococcus sp. MxC21-1]WNZ59239.1 hypothetical protein QEG98_24480 [Myxococcus sp. MxC21-1]